MTKRQQDKIRTELEDKLRELAGASSIRHELITERSNDPMDQMQSRQDLDLTVRTIDTTWKTKKAVDLALKLLRNGEYGTCRECGEAINPKRLEAIPWTTLCVACQEAQDEVTVGVSGDDFRRAA
jgi:RNA polymerase-binding transcription factor